MALRDVVLEITRAATDAHAAGLLEERDELRRKLYELAALDASAQWIAPALRSVEAHFSASTLAPSFKQHGPLEYGIHLGVDDQVFGVRHLYTISFQHPDGKRPRCTIATGHQTGYDRIWFFVATENGRDIAIGPVRAAELSAVTVDDLLGEALRRATGMPRAA
jgi:hypothetical protein